jgi:uncharacterized protein (DUF2235 family)
MRATTSARRRTVKRLVLCCDGTWNTAAQKCPTNVCRISQVVAPTGPDGTEQRCFYHPGVGTRRWERLLGGAFGFGLSQDVQDCYRFLVENYDDGDELFFFGFSRGAFTARSTAGFIRNAGILRRENAGRIPEAYALYRNHQGPDAPSAVAFREQYSVSLETPIRFIGVWDTVGALGIPNLGLPGSGLLNRRYAFHDTQLSSKVESAFQALAIDEQRRPFIPTLWQSQPHAVGQQLEQVWFAGVHCDIGGGFPDRALADITYHWMTERARACNLGLTAPTTPLNPAASTGMLHESRTGLYAWLPPYRRAIGTTNPPSEYVALTAVERTKRDDRYRPPNLETCVAGAHKEMPV